MAAPPPPPPPHGEVPRGSGLPPGKYDIFVIPEHSAGSGFLYLPSLQPNVNSFAAGFASALILVALCQSMAPAFRAWWDGFQGLGSMGIFMMLAGVAFGAWALGRSNVDGAARPNHSTSSQGPSSSDNHGGQPGAQGSFGTSSGAPPRPPPGGSHPGGQSSTPGQDTPRSSWQHRPPPQPGNTRAETPKGSWEKAREEMRKKEEERKAKEAEQKRREDVAKRLAELRAKETRERQEREKEKEKEKVRRETDVKAQAEKLEKEKKEQEAGRKGGSYAYSGVGEKMSMWPNGKPAVPAHGAAPPSPSSPNKKPPAPTAKTYLGTDDDTYSYRPYDHPMRPKHKKSASSIGGSEFSWAPSHTTAHTTPPQSARGPYGTKDPDKIVIKAVYLFMNSFSKTPASQLISGQGSVTDGLILRITTEGLFIDDDVRGVPQREWDVKAWTLKLVEVWCPPHCLNSASASSSASTGAKNSPNLLHKMAASRARHADRGAVKPLTGDEADAFLAEMLHACKGCCRLELCDRTFKDTNVPFPNGQTGEWKSKGLHVLRATVRDQDGKRFFFVIDEHESWKVSASLQRLRRGAQARQLGVNSMSASEARGALEMLGWYG